MRLRTLSYHNFAALASLMVLALALTAGAEVTLASVNQPAAITSANSTTLVIGISGSFTVTTTGSPTPTLSETGALPKGVTFTDNGNGTGKLAGTPVVGTAGGYWITIKAHNGVGADATQNLTLTVDKIATITSANSTAFTVGIAGAFTVTSNGWPIPTLSETGALPTGVTFTYNGNGTGKLAGTPAVGTGGSYAISLKAHNAVGADGTQTFTLVVNQPPAITSANSTTFTVGVAAAFTVTATGWPKPALSATGALPTGVTFTNNGNGTGNLAGTPAAGTAGSYVITIKAHNGVGTDATQNFTLTVNTGPVAPSISSANSTTFTVGVAVVFTVTATGSPTPTLSETGALPTGVTFTDNGNGTGKLGGTPGAGSGGVYHLILTGHNGVGADGTQNFTLTVNQPPAIISANSATFTVGVGGAFTVTATGWPIPTLSETGALPTGVTGTDNGNGTGTLAGTPAVGTAGSYVITIRAHNAVGTDATQNFTLTVNTGPVAPSISSANSTTFTVGVAGVFTVTATGSPTPTLSETGALPTGVTFTDNGNGTAALSGTPGTGTLGAYNLVLTAHNGVGTDPTQNFTLTLNSLVGVDVVTYHNDNARTGQNLNEVILTPTNVNSTTFGKVGFFPVDGLVDAQPLYLSNVSIPGKGIRNVLYVVTENDSVYAFDATTGEVLWKVSVLGTGETPSQDVCTQVTPTIGITSTPVIDRTRGANGVMYLVAASKNGTNVYDRVHAIDITSGAELVTPTTIQASYPGKGANSDGTNVIFDPKQYKERAALLLLNGTVYTTWASHCDRYPYTGWIMAFDATATLSLTHVLNVNPNGGLGVEGGGAIWMDSDGPAADSAGNIYLLDGNGTFDSTLDINGFPSKGDFGNAFLKLSGGLSVSDYFEMSSQGTENLNDVDLGSGGSLVLPDLKDGSGTTWHLAVGAGKDGNLYVVNRDQMGKFNATKNNIYQELDNVLPGGMWSTPAYFNNTVYYGPVLDETSTVGNPLLAFTITNAKLSSAPTSHTAATFPYPGATPGISANGNTNAILWAVQNIGGYPHGAGLAVLHAYDATNLAIELYNSNQAGTRDQFYDNKFITPTIANGYVYVGTPTGVQVFGLLPH